MTGLLILVQPAAAAFIINSDNGTEIFVIVRQHYTVSYIKIQGVKRKNITLQLFSLSGWAKSSSVLQSINHCSLTPLPKLL